MAGRTRRRLSGAVRPPWCYGADGVWLSAGYSGRTDVVADGHAQVGGSNTESSGDLGLRSAGWHGIRAWGPFERRHLHWLESQEPRRSILDLAGTPSRVGG